jgi:hypothetical protein
MPSRPATPRAMPWSPSPRAACLFAVIAADDSDSDGDMPRGLGMNAQSLNKLSALP